MTKDLIIGNASNYSWDQIKYWINSIKKSGFSGDVIVTGTNVKKNLLEKLSEEGILSFFYGNQQPSGDIVSENTGAPHVERFFFIWNSLQSAPLTLRKKYRYVITTDTRDVIFQKNPSDWLEKNIGQNNLVASSEAMKYKNEPWGNRNLYETFGPFFYEQLKDKIIFNVGVIAGEFETVKSLMLLTYQMSINRPIPIVDQAVYNFLIHIPVFSNKTFFTTNSNAWAIQLGTTLDAVKAGSGDLGLNFGSDVTKQFMYQMRYEDSQPKEQDGIIKNHLGEAFTIVHQYDRIPDIREKIYNFYKK